MKPSWGGRAAAFALAWGVVLAVVMSSAAVGAPTVSASDAQGWYKTVIADLTPLQSSLVNGLDAANGWQQRSETGLSAARAITRDLPSLEHARAAVGKLQPLPGQARVRADYTDAIGLYVEAFRLELAATELPPGPLVAQLQRSFERIRELGDVTFDQGSAELAPFLGSSIAGPDVAAAAHVPDWTASGLAPGEPLLPSWQGTSTEPSGSQSDSGWATAVSGDGAPSSSVVHAALLGKASRTRLTDLVGAADRAEVALSSVPVPTSDPLMSNLLRLGLLVDAEGLLVAEASVLTRHEPSRSLASVATTLGSLGADLRGGD